MSHKICGVDCERIDHVATILLLIALAWLQFQTTIFAQVKTSAPDKSIQQRSKPIQTDVQLLVESASLKMVHARFGSSALEDYNAAYDLYVKAEALVDHPRTEDAYAQKAGSCFHLAQLEHFVFENPRNAEGHYRCAVASAEHQGEQLFLGPLSKSQILSYSLKSLSSLYIEQKRVVDAYDALSRAVDIDESELTRAAVSWEDAIPAQRDVGPMGLDTHDLWLDSVLAQNLLVLAPSDKQLVDLAWESSVRAKGRATDVYENLLANLRWNDPKYFESYSNYISALSRVELAKIAPTDSDQQRAEFDKARDKTQVAWEYSLKPSRDAKLVYKERFAVNASTFLQINESLPEGAALIEYVKYPTLSSRDFRFDPPDGHSYTPKALPSEAN